MAYLDLIINIVKGKTYDLKPLMAAQTLCAVVDLFLLDIVYTLYAWVVSFLRLRRLFFSLLFSHFFLLQSRTEPALDYGQWPP